MSKIRRKYSKEQKLEIVKLSFEEGASIKALAERFDISENAIYNWRSKYFKYGDNSFSGHGNKTMTDEQARISRLEKELREAKLERDILKKGGEHLLQDRQQIFQFIMDYAQEFTVERMCRVFKVSKSGYYKWKKNKCSKMQQSSEL